MMLLLESLFIGDYSRALKQLSVLDQNGTIDRLHRERASLEESAPVAELYFYMGRNADGHALLRRFEHAWRQSPERFWQVAKTASTRAQLQVAESIYSREVCAREQFDEAAALARLIRERARQTSDDRGIAEASYYLMRFERRRYKYDEVTRCRHEAAARFTAAAAGNEIDKAARAWRMGLLNLVSGFTMWRVGDLDNAMDLLHTADPLLEQTGDFIARANVRHTIGVIFRSEGRLKEALRELKVADALYKSAGHEINLARVRTDLGRVCLDGGDWKAAAERLNEAHELARPSTRQYEEIALWKSWLAQKSGLVFGDHSKALEWAAIAAESSSRTVRTEGHIAYGYALMKASVTTGAEEQFTLALEEASGESSNPKHRVNALLSLADFHSRHAPEGLKAAHANLVKAEEILIQVSSHFLRAKADAIAHKIGEKLSESKAYEAHFTVTIDDVLKDGIKPTKVKFEKWVYSSTLKKTNNDKKAAAKLLHTKVDTLDRTIRRMRDKSRR